MNSALELELLPLYSQLTSDALPPALARRVPGDFRLARHQVETWEAFQSSSSKVIIQSAMTGDGKSLAAFLPALADRDQALLAAYPTNELLNDQARQLAAYPAGLTRGFSWETFFGDRIRDRLEDPLVRERWELARAALQNSRAVLTNPDLFHLIVSHQWGGHFPWQRAQAALAVNLATTYVVLDEFHVYDLPQVLHLLNGMLYLDCLGIYPRKYLVLSATPTDQFPELLERASLTPQRITGHHASSGGEDWRRVLAGSRLSVQPAREAGAMETWVLENSARWAGRFREQPGLRGALVVNSVYTAQRLLTALRAAPEWRGLRLVANTGLTGASEKARFRESDFDLVVGTSTIDLGIDFRIGFLAFEASTAGRFIQRLGRLGRHAGFASYEAFALVPAPVFERLRVRAEESGDRSVERPVLSDWISAAYRKEQEFEGYLARWGYLQASGPVEKLRELGQQDAAARLEARLQAVYAPTKRMAHYRSVRYAKRNDPAG
jgi:CRISPR-associated endonuclease/helicase Cas3